MSTNLYLNWAIIGVSLFNAILLAWLGLTVLLNAERRDWGVWLVTLGLLLGAAFFISHTTIAVSGLFGFSWRSMLFWWTVGLVPVILLPFAWYVIMLWYAGFWNQPRPALYFRQRYWLLTASILLVLGLAGLFAGMVLLAVPAPQLNPLRSTIRWSVVGVPLLAVGYSAYVLLCIGASVDALRHLAQPQRVMGMIGRQRARPYLMGASLGLLLISFSVVSVMLWVVQDARRRTFIDIYFDSVNQFALIDLIMAALISLVILLVGQGMVSYEVFTGKTLPRRGLMRHWQRAILLAAGYGFLVGGTIALQLRPLYGLLLATSLMVFFYALVSWRQYAERERYIESLRPFAASSRLLDQLLTQTAPQEVDIETPFQALCVDVLGTRFAYLTAVGPLAPLVGQPLAWPHPVQMSPLTGIIAQAQSPQTMLLPIDAQTYNGAMWAVPLWSERGLIGILLLGEKLDGGLYTQEEIEIARITGERLIDTQASAEMSRRLMVLQRERLAQSQIIDRQTRRVLHDDILPELQSAMIALSGDNGQTTYALDLLSDAHKRISDLLHDMPTTTIPEVSRLGLIRALQRAVDDELATAFDEVTWEIAPDAEAYAAQIPNLTAEVIFYAAREAVRNAAKYGRGEDGERPLHLHIAITLDDGLLIQIEDDGVGLNAPQPNEGSGHGLALHSTMMAVIGGEITVDSAPGQYTKVSIRLARST